MNGAQGRTDSSGVNQDAQSAPAGRATGMWREKMSEDSEQKSRAMGRTSP